MTREDANYYLKSSGFSDEQIDTIAKAYAEPLEVEAIEVQKAYNKGFEDFRQAALNLMERKGRALGCDYYEWVDAVEDVRSLSITQEPLTESQESEGQNDN